jgi:hypothetical protein
MMRSNAMHKRSLLLLAALGAFAPVAAEQNAVATGPHASDCPVERAKAAAAMETQSDGGTVVVLKGPRDSAPMMDSGRTAAFAP